jgi:hypothetical protein
MPSMDSQLPEIPIYAIPFLAFTIWMLVDAYRRRAPLHWFLLIFLFSPLGAVVYFFVVKLKDFRGTGAKLGTVGGINLEKLWSFSTRLGGDELDQADDLERRDDYRGAEPLYRAALLRTPNDKRALHGLARCREGLGDYREASQLFETLLSIDREYADFGAALDYVDTLWSANRPVEALELLESLAEHTHRINHRLAFAHYLSLSGDVRRARGEIQRALTEQQALSPDVQRRHRIWVERANTMLAELDQGLESQSPQ